MSTILETILTTPVGTSPTGGSLLSSTVTLNPPATVSLLTEEMNATSCDEEASSPMGDAHSSSFSPVAVSPTLVDDLSPVLEDESVDDEEEVFEDDPFFQVMDFLNFAVVARKPTSIFETLPSAGDIMSKALYMEEKKIFFQTLRTRDKGIVKAQAERFDAVTKAQETEANMKQLVRAISELHDLYAQLIHNLVNLMKNGSRQGDGYTEKTFLTMGPFQNEQELDNLLCLLSGLSNQLNNGFENISQIRKVLKDAIQYVCGTCASTILLSGGGSSLSTDTSDVVNVNVDAYDAYPAPSLANLNEQDMSFNSEDNYGGTIFPSEQCCIPISIPPLETGDTTPPLTFTSVESYDTAAPLATTPVEDDDVVFLNEFEHFAQNDMSQLAGTETNNGNFSTVIPVPTSQELIMTNGHEHFSLVEYPKPASVRAKKHDFDLEKCRANEGSTKEHYQQWFCVCGQAFSSLQVLKYHVRYFNARWKFMCNICLRKYPGFNILKLHMLRTHKVLYVGTNKCRLCPESFETAGELFRHLKDVHNKKIPSDATLSTNCNENNEIPTCYQDSNSSSPTSEIVPLSTYSDDTSNSTTSTNSVLIVNGTKCSCGLELGSKEGLLSHIHGEVETYGQHLLCSLCGEIFNHVCSLKSHFLDEHGIQYQCYQERQYGCSWCENIFGNKEDLETHIVTLHTIELEPSSSELSQLSLISSNMLDDHTLNTSENIFALHNDSMESNMSDNTESAIFFSSGESLMCNTD